MYVAKRGKLAPADERRILLAARAEAALQTLSITIKPSMVHSQEKIGVDNIVKGLEEDA